MRKKEKILPAIKLKYYHKGEDGLGPRYPGIDCFICGRKDIVIGGAHISSSGETMYICEDCAIDHYQKKYGFKSREAAAARRRRIFDVSYLFFEMITDKYLEKRIIGQWMI